MFIGHYAVGFAAKKFAPKASLGPLLAAPLFADILWPIFVLLGVERVRIVPGFTALNPLDLEYMPWSHSLLMDCVWGLVFGGIYYAITKYRAAGIAIFFGVVSHWVLDWVTHRPDMPLAPGLDTKLGLGLWNSVVGTRIVESIMFIAGVWLYLRTTRARDGVGRWAWWGLVALLAVIYFMKAQPGSVQVLVISGLVFEAATLLWAWWADRHRVVADSLAPTSSTHP
jgi:LexA-binding, inner membrane-associated putative hydrolase